MISDKDVNQLFQGIENYMSKHHPITGNLPQQIFRGSPLESWKDQAPGGCSRYVAIFKHYNIIPRYCFSCYKVVVEPRTVLELFKLMMIFDQLELPNNNIRKCIVEVRPEISGTYKGFIYARELDEVEELLEFTQNLVTEKIADNIPISIKRGCSEYSLSYPDYPKVENGKVFIDYNEDWQQQEDHADKNMVINSAPSESDTDLFGTFNIKDYKAILCWLTYASTIGDKSYLKISNVIRRPFGELVRPEPFIEKED